MGARIVIVPGLAVRSYALPAARALARRGHRVSLLRAPAWRGAPATLERYGALLARDLVRRHEQVDLLIGLSVGTQAATAASVRNPRVHRLLLVSPTVDPVHRSHLKLLRAWLTPAPSDHGDDPRFADSDLREKLADWAKAGVGRIALGFRSAVRMRLEDAIAGVSAPTTVVHAEHDALGSPAWAASLRRPVIELAGRPHSWPVHDEAGFVDLVENLLADDRIPERTPA